MGRLKKIIYEGLSGISDVQNGGRMARPEFPKPKTVTG